MGYNIRITPRKAAERLLGDLVVNDLSRDTLEERFVRPYLEGRPITARGRTLDPEAISEIKIGFTDVPSSALLDGIEASIRGGDFVTARGAEEFVPDEGQDVTDDFITGPAGSQVAPVAAGAPQDDRDPRRVMVIHGRNELARSSMFAFLRALDLKPVDWDQAISLTGLGSPHNLTAVSAAMASAQAIIALFTPDDLAYLRPSLLKEGEPMEEPTGQPRPNVLFEAGLAFALRPERTIIVHLGVVRGASDLDGLNYVELPENRQSLRRRLIDAGCAVDESMDAWMTEGDFTSGLDALDDERAAALQEMSPGHPESPDPSARAARESMALPVPGSVSREEYHRAVSERDERIVEAFLERFRPIDQPFYPEQLVEAFVDPKYDAFAVERLLTAMEEEGRIYRNPSGGGWYPK